ncbi:hypothetical protein EVAR_12946_1 [Eumeta japonica]|uniref:Uncharacterized protein n=1 Tax=Eumeta variegata TaxID=151549 RepID=A0A4C1TVU3_EUMVA|nr:hypothetical protein EVAR_12946_1 [Eumeta japonica]
MLNVKNPLQFNYKYLGVTLNRNLHFEDHIERVRKIVIFYRGRLSAMLGLDRDLELSTIAKYMKDVSKRIFDITESQPNALLRSAASYEVQTYHLIHRSRKVFIDPPNALTAKVESRRNTHD